MIKLKREWVFKSPVANIGIEPVSFDIFITKDKRTFSYWLKPLDPDIF